MNTNQSDCLLSNHAKGRLRDKRILESVEMCGCLNTEQIKLLYFPEVSARMAQYRLGRLTEKKKLKRGRESFDTPCYYYLDKKPGQLEHILGVNWVFVWLNCQKRTWEQIEGFEREIDYGLLRSDAFVSIRNTVTEKLRFMFAEMDIAESGNKFDKVELYNLLYGDEKYLGSWWFDYAERFPPVLIVTTNLRRKDAILKAIEKDNANGLEFRVMLLDDIRRECHEKD